ncbi:porphobilinogen deaminase [Alicyclobacillus cellulosilyticus]|uniref:Porphobilinogen deaminase n=1 Tax=Alicyclobacillus cellulosilyticus TaxID=1003997 RepID=A0A917NFP3_9BACL|nr:hydroxymethylbilane synthase [Alicyclobacillus cellulosilyticus]GGI96363.1 porphobilinogen deaminase [Alicyclobacillus cellulosilyticus]
MRVRVASRKSALALQQTRWVISSLAAHLPGWTFEVVPIVTQGDRMLDVSLAELGGKGLFVSEVEQALLDGRADIAVHSLKDVPAEVADGLALAGMPPREDPRDVLIARSAESLADLPPGARVGTSSLRRMALLRALRPDLRIEPLRGNIDTRLRKLAEDGFDAIVLAAAGLKRMGWADRISAYLDPELFTPAVGQGVLAVECRADDRVLCEALRRWTDGPTRTAAMAERALLAELAGGCQVPVGGYATVGPDGRIHLRGMVADREGTCVLRAEARGDNPFEVGRAVAAALQAQGAGGVIAAAQGG